MTPLTKGKPISEESFEDIEIRCVHRKLLLEALRKELPTNTVRYCCKVVSIEDSGPFKALHLADGTILKTKVTNSFVQLQSSDIKDWLIHFTQSFQFGKGANRV